MVERFVIKEAKSLYVAPGDVYALVVEGYNELVQDNLDAHDCEAPFAAGDQVLYAMADAEVVGVLCWRRDPRGVQAVTSAYVEPSSRKQGAMRRLWETMAAHREECGSTAAHVTIHPNNKVAAAVLTKLNARVTSVTFTT